jgi:REP element-mobilizing transposase RayT
MKQLEMRTAPSTHGGWRAGAGRPRLKRRKGVAHRRREKLAARFPVHVTMKVRDGVPSFRADRIFENIKVSFFHGRDRFGMRLVEFSVQGNHIHLLLEAHDEKCLSRGMQGLTIRIAKAINRELGRRGKVFAERYNAHILRSLEEVRRALHYIHRNWHKHNPSEDPRWVDPRSSAAGEANWVVLEWPEGMPTLEDVAAASVMITVPARSWLLRRAMTLARQRRASQASSTGARRARSS